MQIDVNTKDLNTLLGIPNRCLKIPPYQRPYAWETEHVDELWHDILESLNDKQHFMGSLVLCSEDKDRPEVIDGQQRLTTIMLILAYIRDKYAELKPESVGEVQQYIENGFVDDDRKFKLRPGEANRDVFRDFFLRKPDDDQRKMRQEFSKLGHNERTRNGNLVRNADRIAEHIESALREADNSIGLLSKIQNKIMTGLGFVEIDVPDIADAFMIFETLNDRGLALSAGDLLKNHLMSAAANSNQDIDHLAKEWDEIIRNLNGGDITRFLRHYLLMSYKKVQKDDVFHLFKKEVERCGVVSLVQDLKKMSGFYGEFVKPDQVENSGLRAVYENLRTLRGTMCYSALLAASDALDDDDLEKFAGQCEVLTFRYSTICSKDAKDLERIYHSAANSLRINGKAGLEEASRVIVSASPSSEEFNLAFRSQSMGKQYVVNYTFRTIENYLFPDEKTLKDTRKVHIEHIMPLSLSGEWESDLGQDAEESELYVNRWGNLTLLGSKENIGASNKSFADKRKVYEKSKIGMTRMLAENMHWGINEIEQRQAWMAEIADRIWSIG